MTEAEIPGFGVRENYRRQGREQERECIIKRLMDKARDLELIAESIDDDEYMNEGDSDAPRWGAEYLREFADALIKGEAE